MMPLALADIGEDYTIKRIGGSAEVKKHLENLGFVAGGTVKIVTALGGNVIVNVKGITKGVSVTIRKVAPLGDPIEITVRGYELSLRKADAEMIEVE